MNKKRFFVFFLIILILAGCANQKGTKEDEPLHRVGILVGSDFRLTKINGLLETIEEYGFREGENLKIILKNAEGEPANLEKMALELISEDPAVIITTGRVETEAVKSVRKEHEPPIVFLGLTGLKENELVQDLLYPQEGITGINNDHASLSGKRLELLVKLLPGIKNILVLYDPQVIPSRESLLAVREAGKILGVRLMETPVVSKKNIQGALGKWGEEAEAILLLPSVFLESEGLAELIPLGVKYNLPIMGVEHGEMRGLFAVFGISPFDQGAQGARILAKILMGQRPAEIPIEPPASLKLTINLATAEKLGLTLNKDLLGFGDLVYEEGGDIFAP